MNIKLDSRHSIDSDSRQFILMRDERPFKFFITLEHLIQEYLDLKIRGSQAKRLEDLSNYIKQTKKAIVETLTTSQHRPIKEQGGQNANS